MSGSPLLTEALLDAKAIKDVALKNAQEAVLQQFAPEVKKTLNKILKEQIGEQEEDEFEPEPEPDLSLNISEPEQEFETSQAAKKLPLAAVERRKTLSVSR